jgi:DNA gyrase subunit A
MDNVPDLSDGFTEEQRRILKVLAGAGARRMRSDRVLARALGQSVSSLDAALVTDAWRAPQDPHLAAYRTLVQLAQPFTTRYPLIIGSGNFGSRDDEPPADAVFTHCQLSELGAAALAGTVPHLLINGAVVRAGGRAVGCLPHNFGETVAALRALLEQPALSDDELVDIAPLPDFPTGGLLESESAVPAIYRTGAGPLAVRGRATLKAGSIGPSVVVSELPFTVRPADFLAEIADGMRAGRWSEIVNVLDESDQSAIRIVLLAREGTDPEELLTALFERTSLSIVLDVDMVALSRGVVQRVSLPTLLRAYVQQLQDPDAVVKELAALVSRYGDARRTGVL